MHRVWGAMSEGAPRSPSGSLVTVIDVPVMVLDQNLPLPSYAMSGDAGMDLYAREDTRLEASGGRAIVATGIALALPEGYAAFVQPRSGLAARHGVTCLNSPGLIDSGYRGEIKVVLVNTDPLEGYDVKRGDRVAQLVVQRVESVKLTVTEPGYLPSTRGEGGFGHTGR